MDVEYFPIMRKYAERTVRRYVEKKKAAILLPETILIENALHTPHVFYNMYLYWTV
jgi:hypothetical protein